MDWQDLVYKDTCGTGENLCRHLGGPSSSQTWELQSKMSSVTNNSDRLINLPYMDSLLPVLSLYCSPNVFFMPSSLKSYFVENQNQECS